MATTTRGRIPAPDLDDRTWSDLVEEARALIPRYAPQWTDHTESDIGITLIELFAYLVEALLYRLNQVPEKNYAEFLNLLGIRRDPAEAAKAYLTFTAAPANPVTVPKGTQAQTKSTESEQPIVFETDSAVTVLPINLRSVLFYEKVLTGTAFSRYHNLTDAFVRPGAAGGSMLTLPTTGYHALALGFDQPTTSPVELYFELDRPLPADTTITVLWDYNSWATVATVVSDDTSGMRRSGKVTLQAPAAWSLQPPGAGINAGPATPVDLETNQRAWLLLSISNASTGPVTLGIRRILFNTAPAHAALTVGPETLGTSDGKPFQTFALAHGPVFRRPGTSTPYDHLQVTVGGVPWTLVDDFPAGPAQAYRLDPVAGEISFGDYDTTRPDGHGSIPPAGAVLAVPTYRYVAGAASANVGAGTITVMRTPVAGITAVTNYAAGEGGADEETVEEAKRRAPQLLRTRNRAVTPEDYEYLAREATTELAVVRCLAPRAHDTTNTTAGWTRGDPWTFAGIDRGAGNVNMILVPATGSIPDRPEPGPDLFEKVRLYLDQRRDVVARLRLLGPRYMPIRVTIDATVWQRAIDSGLVPDANAVYNDIRARVKAFLHPVTGGPEEKGWAVGQHVYISDLYAAAMPDEHLGFIASLTVQAMTPLYHSPPLGPGGTYNQNERPPNHPILSPASWVRVADYELVCWGDTVLPTVPKTAVA